MSSSCLDVLAVEGGSLTLSASTPLPLSGEGNAWLLTAGEVDLFLAPTSAEGEPGRRFLIGSAAAGSLLLGSDPTLVDAQSWQLLAVGVEAAAERLADNWIEHLADDQLAAGLHAWLGAAAQNVTRSGVPFNAGEAVLGDDVALDTGRTLNSLRELRWFTPETPSLAIGEQRQDEALPLPLGPAAEVGVVESCTGTVRLTADVPPADRLAGLRWAQRAIMTGAAVAGAAERRAGAARAIDRQRLDEAARNAALTRMETIGGKDTWSTDYEHDPILAACQLLGAAQGLSITAPPDWSAGQAPDPVRAIARASGVRVRAVTLEQVRHSTAVEPVLAFRAEAGQPVVLLPRQRGGFQAVDPGDGSKRSADSDYFAGLRPSGYTFYRPLPAGEISVRSLLRSGFRDAGRDVWRMVGLSMIAGLLSLAVPIATGTILGQFVPEGSTSLVIIASIVLVFVSFASTGFLLGRSASLLRLQGRLLLGMQSGLWDRLIALPVQFFTRFTVADLTMRVTGVDAIGQIVASVASTTLLSVVTLVFSLGLLFYYNVALAWLVLAVTAVVVGISSVLTVAQIRRLRRMYDAKGAASGVLLQIVQGIDKVRAAAAENRALGAWAGKFADQAAMLLTSERLNAARTALYAALPGLLTLTVFTVVANNPGAMTTAAFLSFITALGQVASATTQLDLSLGYVLNIVPIFDRMRPILAEPVEIQPGASDPGRLSGRVGLSAVTYRYPGMSAPVLRNINLDVAPGEFVAVVGPSGSGKSTLVRLLLGFDHPEEGTVTYDSKDLRTLDSRAVRSQIGVSLQNASVTGADIKSAIIGDWPLTEQDAWGAAEKVGLADEIRALPMGMHTLLGDNAVTFSGGQRQRLVLASAIARDPRIVILDEATSALDSVTQAQVADSFARLQVTRIVIAHRLSTVRGADRIVVLEAGRVVQMGSYDELAAAPGLFARMVKRQTL